MSGEPSSAAAQPGAKRVYTHKSVSAQADNLAANALNEPVFGRSGRSP